jgi:hypothetical protein
MATAWVSDIASFLVIVKSVVISRYLSFRSDLEEACTRA